MQEVLNLFQAGSRAAPGIGGDPFLSMFADQAGWWSACSKEAIEGLELRRVDHAIVTERATRGRGVASHRCLTLSAGHGFDAGPQKVLVVGRLEQPRTDTRWGFDRGAVDLGHQGAMLTGAARIVGLLPRMELQVSGPLWRTLHNGARVETGAGVRWTSPPALALQATRTTADYPLRFSGDFYDEIVAMRVNLKRTYLRYDARCAPVRWLAGEASLARTWFDELDERNAAPIYESNPGGTARYWQASLELRPIPGWRALVRRTHTELDASGQAYRSGQRFGRIAYARLDLDSSLFALRGELGGGTAALLDVEHGRVDGRLRATIESWPFTPVLIDLIGLRKKYLLTGEASFTRWHIACEQRLGGARVRGGATWYDLRPRAHLATWLSSFFGIGNTDYRHYDLSARRVEMAALSLGGEIPCGRIVGSIALHQFVHAVSRQGKTSGDMPGDPFGSGSPAQETLSGWRGGTVLETSVRLRM